MNIKKLIRKKLEENSKASPSQKEIVKNMKDAGFDVFIGNFGVIVSLKNRKVTKMEVEKVLNKYWTDDFKLETSKNGVMIMDESHKS